MAELSQEICEELNEAESKKFAADNLKMLFQTFYLSCETYFKSRNKLDSFESKRVVLFLKEMNVLADALITNPNLTLYDFYQNQSKINTLKPGLPEYICNYGLKFTAVAFYALGTSLLLGAMAVTCLPISLPVIIGALIVGAAIGALVGIYEANDKVDSWCNRFFRPRDPKPFTSADPFLNAVEEILNPKMKLSKTHNPNGVNLNNNCFLTTCFS